MGGDVAILAVDTSGPTIVLSVDGLAHPARISADPMPADMRHGQFLFNTANTRLRRHHPEPLGGLRELPRRGPHRRGDLAFLQGPRDTPSNAGGVSDTGFLFHTA